MVRGRPSAFLLIFSYCEHGSPLACPAQGRWSVFGLVRGATGSRVASLSACRLSKVIAREGVLMQQPDLEFGSAIGGFKVLCTSDTEKQPN